ncbi:hypothetical protein BDQ17DRAFT_1540401 [Cyathus striatus]|nr:hypothetical protein BDQ17DRAFT_1540401 [Cyathus striatus]
MFSEDLNDGQYTHLSCTGLRVSRSAWCRHHATSCIPALSITSSDDSLSITKCPATPGDVVMDQFHMHLRADDSSFDPWFAWEAYMAILKSSDAHLPPPRELFQFASRILDVVKDSSSREIRHEWGCRLAYLLRCLSSHVNPSTPDDCRRLYLLAHAEGLQTRFDEAFSTLRTAYLVLDNRSDEGAQALNALVKLAVRFLTKRDAIRIILHQWDLLSPHILSEDCDRSLRLSIQNLPDGAFDVLELLADVEIQDHVRVEAGCQFMAGFNRKGFALDSFGIFKYLERMKLDIPLDHKLYLVRSLARHSALNTATQLYLTLPEDVLNPFYMTTGLYVFAHNGDVDKARECYDQLERSGSCRVSDVTTMMLGYTTQGRLEEAVKLFNTHFPPENGGKRKNGPDLPSYTVVITAAAKRGDFGSINHWLQEMVEAGLHPDVFMFTIIMKAFSLRGDVGSVTRILSQMENAGLSPTNITYTDIIAMLAARKDSITAEAVFKHAVCRGIKPDLIMINAVMNAHVETRSWKGVIRTFDYLKSSHLNLSTNIYNTIFKAYVLIGTPFEIVSKLYKRLLEKSLKPDPYTYSLLAQSACNSGDMDAASSILKQVEQRSWGRKRNDMVGHYIRSIIMSGYLRQGNLTGATEVYQDMISRGFSPSVTAMASIVKTYANVGNREGIHEAEQFITSIIPSLRKNPSKPITTMSPLEVIYAPLLAAQVKQLNPTGVERSYQHMLDNGGEPNLSSLTALVDVYRRTSNVEAISRLWPQILDIGLSSSNLDVSFDKKFGRTELLLGNFITSMFSIPLSFYIDVMSSAGKHVEVAEAWNKAQSHGFTFNSHHWNHMVVALVRAGEVERAFDVVEHIIIPSEVGSQKFRFGRVRNPSSPLLFSDNDELPINYQIKGTVCQTNVPSEEETVNDFDFALPLEIIRGNSPLSNTWRPHTATLTILYGALQRLQSARMVNPIKPGNDDPPIFIRHQEALSTFKRICANCPKSVARVAQFWKEHLRTPG